MTLNKRKRIIFTGGGSAGHVTPNLTIINALPEKTWDVFYIGSKNGIEKTLLSDLTTTNKTVSYHAIQTGKLRRYFSWQNFIDPFKVYIGFWQSLFLCYKIRPNLIFSKGGFVSLPVVIAAWLLRIPVILHESDLMPGLANKLTFPFATKICLAFADTKEYLKKYAHKTVITGNPIRPELLQGDAEAGRKFCDFNNEKKIIFVFAGSLGSASINNNLRKILPQLLQQFQIVHITGEKQLDPALNFPNYRQFAYIGSELKDVMAAANIIVSRAGANSVFELLALRKPHLLIPLPTSASRGEQLANAKHFEELGFSQVLREEELTPETLQQRIVALSNDEEGIRNKLASYEIPKSSELICDLITKYAKNLP